ncbi:hypothetical protein GO003_013770 [Methylicorpusculum oleiharenae]|uniref:hypothetical protein n=1 Tax=Methylicorpusculum oleiharenae TaxID=1338687 RepID=UPI00135A90C2|nr:hypothetical protein [Methylicorpusculum oleiharenae]MCD2451458.1 hypothetical protein [Methylicorpusculum oleiharenae]
MATLYLLLFSSTSAFAIAVQDLRGEEAQTALHQFEAKIKENPNDFEALKSAGIILHQLSRTHADKQQISTSENYLKSAKALQENDPETSAWLGSVTTMKALFESDPGKKTFFVKLGTRLLDKAVQTAPDNTVVRLTRAYNSLELPAFLMRTKFAVEDFKHYLKQCESQGCPQEYIADANAKLAEAEKILVDNF